jgi:hypothetical protein
MINSLKKAAVVATLFTVVSSLTPKSAEAGFARFSGRSVNTSIIDFNLDTDAPLVNGEFIGAIKDFKRGNTPVDSLNLDTCGNVVCPPGNLKISKLATDANGFVSDLTIGNPGEKITLNTLQTLLDAKGVNRIKTSGDVVRYDLSFGTTFAPELVWFVQSSDSSLLTNLSKLSEFNDIVGILPKITSDTGGTFNLKLKSQPVPEPNSSLVGLVGVGMLGAASLRYKKRLQMKTVVEEMTVETPEMMQIK